MRWLGIDPGLAGGIAVLDQGMISHAFDVPVAGEGAKRRVETSRLFDFLRESNIHHAFIERAQAMPDQGASSGFIYGRAVGALEACISAAKIPITVIEARTWKKYFGLPGGPKGKEASRLKVLQLFPTSNDLFKRKCDHQRAEAVLIALYGAECVKGIPQELNAAQT